MPATDSDLVSRARAGDGQAFADLVSRYGGLVHAAVLAVVGDRDVAEDLAQDTFCRAYESLQELRQPERVGPWLAQIARRTALGWLRRERRRRPTEAAGEPLASLAAPLLDQEIAEAEEREELELGRMVDTARGGAGRSETMAGEGGVTTGLVKFTRLRLRGAGSGTLFLSELADYLQRHLGMEARVDAQPPSQRFLNPRQLEYPVHFLLGGGAALNPSGSLGVALVPEELELLRQYLAQGGLLFIEGSRPYLASPVADLRQVAPPNSRLIQIPFDHPLYRAAYRFEGGFPGEVDRPAASPAPPWYYPAATGPREAHMLPDGNSPLGLWGVEWQGELVVLLSDLGLFVDWEPDVPIAEADAPNAPTKLVRLEAAANVVVYALARPNGLSRWRSQPAWSARP